ncbi:MAG TPA: TetR/AcrR family transcriptional regulator [Roseiflexaceae bacterium]|nr:TetR/AcrR family transcriptional regulator [Roseiflexaceae bacterium]
MDKTDSNAPSPAPKRYHHGDLRNALIRAAQALLAQEGIAGLDLRKVARAAGVSHAAPYRHFADKQALLAAIAEDGFHQLAARMDAALAQAPGAAADRLEQLARAYVQFALDQPAHMREMFSGLTVERAAYPDLHAAAKEAFGRVTQVVERGQAQGEIGPGDAANLSTVAWTQIHGIAMLLIEDQLPGVKNDPQAVAGLIAQCMRTLYTGLGRSAGN